MNNEHYLIHKADYISHIDDKVMLYSFVKQLTHHIAKMKMPHAYGYIGKMAKHYDIAADKLFDSWGIPKSYLVFDNEEALAELMENELIAPEDAGYIPCEEVCDDECFCDCCGCEDCPYANGEDDEEVEDEADNDGVDISEDDFIEMITAMSSMIHKIFGDKVSVHIIVED